MGSWNETCGLTHLPILPGDAVYGLILTMPPRVAVLGTASALDYRV